MYSLFQITRKYISYYFTASNGKGHGIHSPFIFQFITRVLNEKKNYDEYARVEELRKRLLNDKTVLTIRDLGAGSATGTTNKRTIASLAANAAKPKKFGQLLYRMVKTYQPKIIVELGTSLGITTAYLSLASPEAKLLTLEGADEVAAIAAKNFETLRLQNIELIRGNFDDSLPDVLEQTSSVGLAFIDGNHRQEPTERYFRDLLPKMKSDSILIFDDIHWSQEMEQAWETIKADPAVRCTVDLFFIGLVFFREEIYEKQHFTIRF